jgi:hypothetical protein
MALPSVLFLGTLAAFLFSFECREERPSSGREVVQRGSAKGSGADVRENARVNLRVGPQVNPPVLAQLRLEEVSREIPIDYFYGFEFCDPLMASLEEKRALQKFLQFKRACTDRGVDMHNREDENAIYLERGHFRSQKARMCAEEIWMQQHFSVPEHLGKHLVKMARMANEPEFWMKKSSAMKTAGELVGIVQAYKYARVKEDATIVLENEQSGESRTLKKNCFMANLSKSLRKGGRAVLREVRLAVEEARALRARPHALRSRSLQSKSKRRSLVRTLLEAEDICDSLHLSLRVRKAS